MDVDTTAANLPNFVPVSTLPLKRGAIYNGEVYEVVEPISDGFADVHLVHCKDHTPFNLPAATLVLSRKLVLVVTDAP